MRGGGGRSGGGGGAPVAPVDKDSVSCLAPVMSDAELVVALLEAAVDVKVCARESQAASQQHHRATVAACLKQRHQYKSRGVGIEAAVVTGPSLGKTWSRIAELNRVVICFVLWTR